MSIEQQIAALTAALEANTQATLGNGGTGPAPNTAIPANTPAAAPSAPVAPVPPAAVPATPPAAAPLAAASPSNPAPPPAATPPAAGAVSFEQLQQEVTAIYQTRSGDPRISEIVTRYGGALSNVAPEQYNNLLGELRSLA